MMVNPSKSQEINILASDADWAWPVAVRRIFQPRGVNMMVAKNAGEFVNILHRKRIHSAIVDMESQWANGLATVKILKTENPLLPCLLLSSSTEQKLLGEALELNVFSVISKPVSMKILNEQLNRLFIKKYNLNIFGEYIAG